MSHSPIALLLLTSSLLLAVCGCGGDDAGDAGDTGDAGDAREGDGGADRPASDQGGASRGGDGADGTDDADPSRDADAATTADAAPPEDAADAGPGTSQDAGPSEPECEGSWPVARTLFEQEILDAINAERETGGDCGSEGTYAAAPPLELDDALQHAARCQAEYMASQLKVGFEDADGNGFSDRAANAGYAGFALGSAIAASSTTQGRDIFDTLFSNPQNCRTFLRSEATDVGIGAAPGGGRNYVEVAVGQR